MLTNVGKVDKSAIKKKENLVYRKKNENKGSEHEVLESSAGTPSSKN